MLNKLLLSLCMIHLLSCNNTSESQESLAEASYRIELEKHREMLDNEFKTSKKSPFYKYKNFKQLNFFEADIKYRIRLKPEIQSEPEIIQFETTTERKPIYLKKYLLRFNLSGQGDSLWGYIKNDSPNRIFVPFKDKSNQTETYGGGRYVDIEVETDSVWLDFNKAYNPYCHYDTGYSCPIVPFENHLQFPVNAGEKRYKP